MKDLFIISVVIYFLWVMFYLLREHILHRRKEQRLPILSRSEERVDTDDIIGKSTFDLRHSLPQAARKENRKNGIKNEDTFVSSIGMKSFIKIPEGELDETFSHTGEIDSRPMNISILLEYENEGDFTNEEEEETWLPTNLLAEGSTFEEMGSAVRTVLHHNSASLLQKEQAGAILLKLRQTDMFEQLVQSAPGREDIVGEVINMHLTAYQRRQSVSAPIERATKGQETPCDFDIRDFV